MLNVVVWVILGGVVGLLGSLMLHTESQQGVMTNVLVAVGGALAAELVLASVLPASRLPSDFGLPALAGACALLAMVSGVRGLAQRYRPGE